MDIPHALPEIVPPSGDDCSLCRGLIRRNRLAVEFHPEVTQVIWSILPWLIQAAHSSTGTMPFALAKDQATIEAPVTRVVDGDTFKLKGQTRSIRIWGLYAPERDMPGGPAATAALRQLISGEMVRCLIHDIDRYRPFVGQCFPPDGRDIAAEMIATGRSGEYCRYSKGYYGTCCGG